MKKHLELQTWIFLKNYIANRIVNAIYKNKIQVLYIKLTKYS